MAGVSLSTAIVISSDSEDEEEIESDGIITVKRPGLLSAWACVRSDGRNTKQNAVIAMAQATLEGFAIQKNPTRKS